MKNLPKIIMLLLTITVGIQGLHAASQPQLPLARGGASGHAYAVTGAAVAVDLHTAVYNGDITQVQALLNDDNINAYDADGNTPLYVAITRGHTQLVHMLINNNANITKLNKFQRTALHSAAIFNHPDIVRYLIKHGVAINAKDDNGNTALHLAAAYNHSDVILTILDSPQECGLGVAATNADGKTALELFEIYAIPSDPDNADIVRKFWAIYNTVVAAFKIRAAGYTGKLLHWAVESGNADCVETLIKSGAHVDSKTNDGERALHLASAAGHTTIVKTLIRAKTKIDSKSPGHTALHAAARGNHPRTIKALLKARALTNIPDSHGATPLHIAASENHVYVANTLLASPSAWACINTKNPEGNTALHLAVRNKSMQVFKAILRNARERGFYLNINAQNRAGDTPLHCAVATGNAYMVAQLIAAGADGTIPNTAGLLPINVIIETPEKISREVKDKIMALLTATSDKN